MLTRRIYRGDCNTVWIVVRNASQTAMGEGRGVVWYTAGSEGTEVTWHTFSCRALLAGIVGTVPLQPGAFGVVQVWGSIESLLVNIPFTPHFRLLDWGSAATLPLDFATTAPPPDTLAGALSTQQWTSTHTTLTSWVYRAMAMQNPGVWALSNRYNKETSGSNLGYMKGFVKAL